ncbi:MAG: S26 family signal peptidase [Pseudomonadota bacterium]
MATKAARRRRFLILLALGLAYAAYQALSAFHARYVFTVNHTASLSHWAFIVDRRATPERGDLIYFAPPDNPYYADTGFVKIIAGVAGDEVRREERTYFVNDVEIGAAKPRSQKGDPLEPGPVGVIPANTYFVFTPHKDSYDSRYKQIGWIGRDRIIGVARPVL